MRDVGRQYLWNVFSHNSDINPETGYNEEETKAIRETAKIFGDDSFNSKVEHYNECGRVFFQGWAVLWACPVRFEAASVSNAHASISPIIGNGYVCPRPSAARALRGH